ncbi:MAG TPA: glycosyltransferase family 2 protein [Burkholderiales bacterium]|nr:glycosyltransferase family 2 protein [Burkholderiales bacterium]
MNSEQPRISVVIPLYNKQAYVVEAVNSVLQSGYPAHEIIVVDDGSTDDGPRLVSEMPDSRVRLIRAPHGGAGAARNRGVSEASGDFIAFLDADDYWTPGYLPAIVDLIARFPDCGIYATHFFFLRENRFRQVPRLWRIRAGAAQRIERFFDIWSHGSFLCTNSVVIPLRILRDYDIRFPEERNGQDQDVWFRIAERWPTAYLAQPLAAYRQGVPGSLMSSHPAETVPSIERLAARYRRNAIPEQHRRGVSRLLVVDRLMVARRLLVRGQRRRAIRLLYDLSCLRVPRFWLRLMLAAHTPSALRQYFIPSA